MSESTTQSVVVPVEPTNEMLVAMSDNSEYLPDIDGIDLIGMWRAAIAAAPAPPSLAGGEDSALKVATDLHAAYEALIYGLPKYLEAENLTDEENMIREAWIKLDVTAHRLAALSPEAPAREGRRVAGEILDALWPILGGSQMPAETWEEIDAAVSHALTPCHEAPAEGAGERLLRPAGSKPTRCYCLPDRCDAPVIMGRQTPCIRARSSAPEARS